MDILSMAFEVIAIGSVVVAVAFIVNRATDIMTKEEQSKPETKSDAAPDPRQTRTKPDTWHDGESKPKPKPKKKKTTKKKTTKKTSSGKSSVSKTQKK